MLLFVKIGNGVCEFEFFNIYLYFYIKCWGYRENGNFFFFYFNI